MKAGWSWNCLNTVNRNVEPDFCLRSQISALRGLPPLSLTKAPLPCPSICECSSIVELRLNSRSGTAYRAGSCP